MFSKIFGIKVQIRSIHIEKAIEIDRSSIGMIASLIDICKDIIRFYVSNDTMA